MKRILSFILLVCVSYLFAQEHPFSLLTHSYYLRSYINPAEAGTSDVSNVALVGRTQWNQIQDNPTNLSIISDFTRSHYKRNVTWIDGFGAFLNYTELGFLNKFSVDLRLASEIINKYNSHFRIGINGKLERYSINKSELTNKELLDPIFDDRFNANSNFRTRFDLGLNYRIKSLNIGLIAYDIERKIKNEDDIKDFKKYLGNTQFVFHYPLDIGQLALEPRVIYSIPLINKSQIEANIRATFQESFHASIGFRQGFGITFGFAYSLNRFALGYAYDFNTNDNIQSSGSSELMLQFINNEKEEKKKEPEETSEVVEDTLIDSLVVNKEDSIVVEELIAIEETDMTKEVEKEQKAEGIKKNTEEIVIENDEKSANESKEELIDEGIILVDPEDPNHLILEHIGFETNSDILKPYSYKEFDKLINFLKKYGYKSIVIEGHTDNVGSERLNKKLSERRAIATKNYFISKGIENLTIIGYGVQKPLSTNDTEEGRQLNRRIEIRITK